MQQLIQAALLVLTATYSVAGFSTTFYVRNGGDDSADGRSDATAWATLDRVNSYSFAAGDSVLFHEGDVWQGMALEVDWSGTATQPAVIGAYHMVGGTEERGFSTGRPIIDGAHKVPSRYRGLIQVTGDRVRLENLEIVNSEGRGVQFQQAQGSEVVDLSLSDIFNTGIKLIKSPDALIEGNYVTRVGLGYIEEGADWGGAIAAVESARTTIRDNQIVEVQGEGIGVNHNSADTIIEDNYVFAARAVGIYIDATPRATVRRNIVVGTADSHYWRSNDTVGSGIVLNNEKYHYSDGLSPSIQSQDVNIYANVVAYTNEGIAFWGQLDDTRFANVKVFNNTFVDNDVQIQPGERPKPETEFVNNIALSLTSGTKDVAGNNLAGGAARYNYFSQGDPGGDFSDSHNLYSGLELTRMTGWRTIDDAEEVSWLDFTPKQQSPTIGAGDDSLLAIATALNTFDEDLNAKPHNDPLDIGAIRFTSSKVPRGPSGFTIRTTVSAR